MQTILRKKWQSSPWIGVTLILVLLFALFFEDYLGLIGIGILWSAGLATTGFLVTKRLPLILLLLFIGGLFLAFHLPLNIRLVVIDSNDIREEFFALYALSFILAVLIQKLRNQATELQEKEKKTRILYELAHQLSTTQSLQASVLILMNSFSQLGFPKIAFFMRPDEKPDMASKMHPLSLYEPTPVEITEAEHLILQPRQRPLFQINSNGHYYCALQGLAEQVGFIILGSPPPYPLSEETLHFLEAIANQLAIGLERELLRERSQALALMEKAQVLYKALLNSISHELKTPLATITGSASALLDPVTSQDLSVWPALTQEILQASQRLTEVLDKLLDMSRIDSGMLRPRHDKVDMRDIIAMTYQRLIVEGAKNNFMISCEMDQPILVCDPVLLSQALYYVLQNAVRYGKQDAPISIDIHDFRKEIIIKVRDQGPGISLQHKEKIFDRFYRGHPEKTGGLGLGLSIAHGFLEVHGGRITADNHPKGGAEFTLFIPKGGASETP